MKNQSCTGWQKQKKEALIWNLLSCSLCTETYWFAVIQWQGKEVRKLQGREPIEGLNHTSVVLTVGTAPSPPTTTTWATSVLGVPLTSATACVKLIFSLDLEKSIFLISLAARDWGSLELQSAELQAQEPPAQRYQSISWEGGKCCWSSQLLSLWVHRFSPWQPEQPKSTRWESNWSSPVANLLYRVNVPGASKEGGKGHLHGAGPVKEGGGTEMEVYILKSTTAFHMARANPVQSLPRRWKGTRPP